MAARTWLVDLPPEACSALIDEATVGRLGVVVEGRPMVFPVAHVIVDGDIIFPTNRGTKMHAALEWPWVGFEVDAVEGTWESGWSVMVSGRAEEVTDPDVIERAVTRRTSPWRTGSELVWIRVIPTTTTGRRIDAEPND